MSPADSETGAQRARFEFWNDVALGDAPGEVVVHIMAPP